MGNYFSTSNTESITIINETDHVHVVMSDTQQVTNESKNVNEEKTSIITICDKEELKVDTVTTAPAAADKTAVIAAADNTAVIPAADKTSVVAAADKTAVIDTKVTSTICKKNVKKNKKNKKKK